MTTAGLKGVAQNIEKSIGGDPHVVVFDHGLQGIGHQNRNHRDIAEAVLEPGYMKLNGMFRLKIQLIDDDGFAKFVDDLFSDLLIDRASTQG